jgi:hydrocephalus-inducing protein
MVPAGGEASVVVRVLLDDAAPFTDTLHVLVSEGADVSVPLEAIGVGNTVVSEVLSKPQLDFGPQFVGRGWQMEVEVTNMGRKAVTLTWTNRRMAEVLDAINKAAKGTGELCMAEECMCQWGNPIMA